MEPSSPAQAAAALSGTVPPLEQVRDDVWSLGMPMPAGALPYSLLTLLRDADGGVHLVDPGTDSDDNWALLTTTLETLGTTIAAIRSVTATHLHADHLGMAARVRGATGAPIQVHEREAQALHALATGAVGAAEVERLVDEWGVPPTRRPEILTLAARRSVDDLDIDRLLLDGERLDIPGFELDVVWTPGHTPGHSCLRDIGRGILLSGDHLLPTQFAGLGLGGPSESNALSDYLVGLDRIAANHDLEVLPGHGFRFRGLLERVEETRRHQLARAHEVADIVARDADTSIWELAARLSWSSGWQGLRGFTLYSALSQTAMHREFVRDAAPGSF